MTSKAETTEMEEHLRSMVERLSCQPTKGKLIRSTDSFHMSLVVRKPVFGVSDQVRHLPGCAATEMRLEISDLGSTGIALSV